MPTLPLSESAQKLVKHLGSLQLPPSGTGNTLHVEGVGGRLYFAYEQLRNAADYSEQHLVLRRAIERFLQRSANLHKYTPIASELVIELTQARYLENDS